MRVVLPVCSLFDFRCCSYSYTLQWSEEGPTVGVVFSENDVAPLLDYCLRTFVHLMALAPLRNVCRNLGLRVGGSFKESWGAYCALVAAYKRRRL